MRAQEFSLDRVLLAFSVGRWEELLLQTDTGSSAFRRVANTDARSGQPACSVTAAVTERLTWPLGGSVATENVRPVRERLTSP